MALQIVSVFMLAVRYVSGQPFHDEEHRKVKWPWREA